MVEIEAVEDPKLWPTLPSLVERRTDEILAICQRAEVRGTFLFLVGWPRGTPRVAHRRRGHEYTHSSLASEGLQLDA